MKTENSSSSSNARSLCHHVSSLPLQLVINNLPVVVVVCAVDDCVSPCWYFLLWPHVDWALWLCCLQGQGGKRRNTRVLCQAGLGFQTGTGQMAGAMGGARAHTRTHMYTHTHMCIHAQTHTYTNTQIYTEERSKDSINLICTHTFALLLSMPAISCMNLCVLVCFSGPRLTVFIMRYRRTACWCITGRIPWEQGHRMTSCQAVMNVIYTCRLSK